MVDLAVPRDIEPEVARLDDVYLYTVDDLAAWSRPARREARGRGGAGRGDHRDRRAELRALARPARLGAADPGAERAGRRVARLLEIARASKLLASGEDVDAVLEALSRGLTQKMLHGTLAELHAAARSELQKALLPRDPNDERNVFLEIRAGTGGDESRALRRRPASHVHALRRAQRWQVEIVSESAGDLGGYKEVIARIVGDGATRASSSSRAATACSACRPPRRRAASTPRLHGRRDARGRRGEDVRSTRPTCASTPSARAAPAASTSTRPTRRCASPTCRPASWSSARTTLAAQERGEGAGACWPRASRTRSSAARARREGSGDAQGPDRQRRPQRPHPHLQLPAGPRHRPPHQPDALQARRRPAPGRPAARAGDRPDARRRRPGALRAIVAGAGAHLVPGGWLLLEHGFDQAAACARCSPAPASRRVETRRDLAGHERATGGRRPAA
jgi:hypothetical protein